MSEQKIENIINNVLSGDALKNALDFAEYLNANKMTANGAEISYQGKPVCYMHLEGAEDYPGPWTIWTEGDYRSEHEDVPMDDNMKEIAWSNVNTCGDCGGDCSPGKSKLIFGKKFDNVCNADMAFYIPDAETLKCVKKLLEMRKHMIANNSLA